MPVYFSAIIYVCLSIPLCIESFSPSSPSLSGVPFTHLDILEATHRGLHKFIPRHHDEIEVDIGDPIYMQKEADDLWCEGMYILDSFVYLYLLLWKLIWMDDTT